MAMSFCLKGYIIDNNTVILWNSEDVIKLRSEHRIVGGFLGALPTHPKQNNVLGLPLKLMPEETSLLLEQNVMRLKKFTNVMRTLSPSEQEQIKVFFRKLQEEDQSQQLKEYLSSVGAHDTKETSPGRAGSFSPLICIHTEDPFKDERIVETIKKDTQLNLSVCSKEGLRTMPDIDCGSNSSSEYSSTCPGTETKDKMAEECVIWNWPQTQFQVTKYRVFCDLWKRGFYVTSGLKFGGDYLIYDDDPVAVHSRYIAKVFDWDEQVPASTLVAVSRLGGKVKKQTLFCSVNTEGDSSVVCYLTLSWSGIRTNNK